MAGGAHAGGALFVAGMMHGNACSARSDGLPALAACLWQGCLPCLLGVKMHAAGWGVASSQRCLLLSSAP